jgi:hypothetical protein
MLVLSSSQFDTCRRSSGAHVSAIVAGGSGWLAAKKATTTIPIVFTTGLEGGTASEQRRERAALNFCGPRAGVAWMR